MDDTLAANKRLVLDMVERVVGKGDWDAALEYFTDDFVAHGTGPEPAPLEALKRLTLIWKRAFPDWRDEIEELIAERDLVMLRIRATGTHLGRLAGIAPTGERCTWGMIEMVRVRDGKIAEQWGYSDFGDVVARLREIAGRGTPPKASA